jgi:hypothetical protein
VRVHPRARTDRLEGDGSTLQLWVREPPADGRANAAVIRAVARWTGVTPSQGAIVLGATARTSWSRSTARTRSFHRLSDRRSRSPAARADPGQGHPGPPRARPGRHARDVRRHRDGGGDLPVLALYPARHQRPDPQAPRGKQMAPAPPAPFLPPSGPPTRRCAPGSPPPSTATSNSPTTTPGSAASSPAHSANSGPPGPDQVTIQTREKPSVRPRASVKDTVRDGTPQVTAPADTRLKITGGSMSVSMAGTSVAAGSSGLRRGPGNCGAARRSHGA